MDICRKITGLDRLTGATLVHTNCADLKIVFVTDEIVRVRASFDKELAEESYILMTTAWEDRLDPLFEGQRTRVNPVEPKITEGEKTIVFDRAVSDSASVFIHIIEDRLSDRSGGRYHHEKRLSPS